MTNPLVDTLRGTLQRVGLSDSPLIAAVSGGPDSLALILALVELRPTLHVEPRIAHFDHRLRRDSADDAAFVEDLGVRLGVPVSVGRGDVRAIASREKIGLEEAGRRARYRFLAECQERFGAAVLVGHTADDQIETRLMHWLRGSGLPGLVGMAEDVVIEVPDDVRVRVVRPLLRARHQDALDFCRERGVQPRIDPSNADVSFTRNRLRQEVVPTLRAINPRLVDSLDRLARHADAAEAFIQSELERRISAIVTSTASREWRIDRQAWRSLPTALKSALLRRASVAVGRAGSGPDADHLDAGVRAADTWSAGKILAWPDGLELCVEYDSIVIRRGGDTGRRIETRTISTAGERDIEVRCSASPVAPAEAPRILRVRRRPARCGGPANDAWHCDLDAARLDDEGGLIVRARQCGDWILPEGMTGRKKVQDLLVDAHLPRSERDRVPIVATATGVAWVVGVRRDRRYVASDATRDVLCLRLAESGSAVEEARHVTEASAWAI
ncbi:MAG: tRNA lysidine(34) synthetase TilS [Chloroflexota bacterium]